MRLLTRRDRRDPDLDMGQRSVTREVPRLTLRATFDLSTVNVEKRTVGLTWTTGARVLRGFFEPYWEELSLDPKHVRMQRLQSGAAPVLNSHRSEDIADILGVVEDAQLGKKEGRATARFDSGVEGEDAFRRVREGTLRNVSVGYSTYRMQKIEDGSTTIPVYRAIDWEPAEISLLPIGADGGAVTRSAGGMNPCVFIEERAMDPADANPTTTNPAPAAIAPAPQPIASDGKERAALDLAARTAENARVTGIQRIGRALNRPQAEIDAAVGSVTTTLDAFRTAAVDAVANAPAAEGGVIGFDKRDARIQAGADQRDKYLQRSENWIIVRAGLGPMMKAAAEKRGDKIDLDPGESRGLTLVEMARECLERAGVRTRGMDVMQMIGLAFTHRGGGMNTTSDFPILLENVQNKTLLAAYATTPDTWRNWCVVGSVPDFRASNRYRQGSFGTLKPLNEAGEFKNASIPDAEKQSITAATKGLIVAISRQTIINDDMGALTDIATRHGRSAALTIEVDAYAYLASNPVMSDGVALFHATHGNIGVGAALSVASIDADRVLMKGQMDPAKNELLELAPAVLLVPAGLGGQARVINTSQYDTDKIANGRNQEPNKVVGLYRNIIDTARLAAGSTTRYSFADPAIAPTFEVAFLNGQENPYLEMQMGWWADGVEWKVRLDFGIGARDWRGVVRNAGA